MKKIFIIRHAKSDQSFFGNDFERPLNERGRKDAPEMAKRLKGKQSLIDAFVSSPARRAKKTAEIFAGVFGKPAEEVVLISALYHASPETFFEEIRNLPDDLETVALFSHNPGITYFVNQLVPDIRIDNMPTCGIFAVECQTGKWSEFGQANKLFLFFDYPKSNL